MPIHRLAVALCLTLLAAGCMTHRDSTDMNDDEDTMENDAVDADTVTTPGGGMPNVPVYLDGVWDFTATPIDGGESITGTLTIADEPGASRVVASNGIDAPFAIQGREMTNASFTLDGTLQTTEGPVPVHIAGALDGDAMSAEAEVEGIGTFTLTGTRRAE